MRELEEAYRRTTFVVFVDGAEVPVRVGRVHPALDRLLAGEAVGAWAFITAWNPGSEPLPVEVNRDRQSELVRDLGTAGFAVLTGLGVPDRGDWPPEESVLALGISRLEARAFGRRFGQSAIVCGRAGQPAELVWCLEEPAS